MAKKSTHAFGVALLLIGNLAAQCQPNVTAYPAPQLGASGMNGATVGASAFWDPDGPGPLQEQLVIAGYFTHVDGVACENIARFDPVAGWQPIGSGLPGVSDVDVSPSGELAVLDRLNTGIWHWDGTAWVNLVNGPNSASCMAYLANGDLAVGTWASNNTNYVWIYDGSWWMPLLPPPGNQGIVAVVGTSNGDLIASVHGTSPTLWRWSGSSWLGIPDPTPAWQGQVLALAASPTGQIAAGSWQGGLSLGGVNLDPNAYVRDIEFMANGDMLVIGDFSSIGSVTTNWVARWDGTTFHPISTPPVTTTGGTSMLTVQEMPNGDIFVGGRWDTWAGVNQSLIALHTASGWAAFGTVGFDGNVRASIGLRSGDAIVAGEFTKIDSVTANHIVRRTANGWQALGSGTDGDVMAVAQAPNGHILGGGTFTMAGGQPASNVARWDGASWHALGSGVNGPVTAIAVGSNGDVYVSGAFSMAGGTAVNNLARFDGANWFAVGGGLNQPANALLVEGSVLTAVGNFTSAGGQTANRIAQFDGSTWSNLGTGFNGEAHALLRRANNDLVVAGAFTAAGGQAANQIAAWNGSNWSALGSGLPSSAPIRSLALVAHDTLMAAHEVGPGLHRLSRWDGAAWNSYVDADDAIVGLANFDNGLLVSGPFTQVDGQATSAIAEVASTCAATTSNLGMGCLVAGQTPELRANSLPWLGATVPLEATRLPLQSVAFGVYGMSISYLPLSALLPTVPGCSTLVSPDLVVAGVPSAGVLTNYLSIPTNPALVGTTVYHTVLALEISGGNVAAAGMTNGLRLNIGTM